MHILSSKEIFELLVIAVWKSHSIGIMLEIDLLLEKCKRICPQQEKKYQSMT